MKWWKKLVVFSLLIILINIFPANFVKGKDLYKLHPTDDAQIAQNYPPNNYGKSESMSVRNQYGGFPPPYGNGWARDALVKFDLSSLPVSPGDHVYAKLEMYYYKWWDNNPTGRELTAYRITSDWSEDTVTWNTQPSYDYHKTAVATVPHYPGKWMVWDVTPDVQDFIDGKKEVYGWRIRDEKIWGDANIPITYFRTKEYGNYAPTLEVIVDNVPPSVEITHPKYGLYISDRKIIPLPFTIVIGNVTVQAFASDEKTGILRVELYVDGTLKNVSYNEPYTWELGKIGSGLHKIEVKAYDKARNVNSKKETLLLIQ